MDLNVLAFGLMGTAALVSAKDLYETRPGAWLAGAEKLLRRPVTVGDAVDGVKIHIAKTGSVEEIDKWVAEHDGTTDIDRSLRADIERALSNDV